MANQLRLEGLEMGFDEPQDWRKLIKIPASNVKTLPDISRDSVPRFPLWGQYYRFLPLKLVVRVLANLSIDEPPKLEIAREICVDIATKVGQTLKHSHKELSTTFPEDSEKSKTRFANQYVGHVKSPNKLLVGMSEELLFINIMHDRMGLTSHGITFAKLRNPVIDDGEFSQSLSEDESMFLIKHIMNNVKDEAEHILHLLKGLKETPLTRIELNKHMEIFYRRYYNGREPWSPQMIETMRAGLTSRAIELGLIGKEKKKSRVYYYITNKGLKVLNEQTGWHLAGESG